MVLTNAISGCEMPIINWVKWFNKIENDIENTNAGFSNFQLILRC